MQKLIAARRPTMHIRPIDGVRLVELICVCSGCRAKWRMTVPGRMPRYPSGEPAYAAPPLSESQSQALCRTGSRNGLDA